MTGGAPRLRRGTPADTRSCADLLWAAATDLGRRHGHSLEGTADAWWEGSASLHAFLAEHAAEWWVAEDPDAAGRLIGYARSIERGGLFELTEFFVDPGSQSGGIGGALMERAFPLGRGELRAIIATTEVRALSRYYRSDTVARFPWFTLMGTPSGSDLPPTRLHAERLSDDDAGVRAVAALGSAVTGFPHGDAELRWLLEAREGWLFSRSGEPVAFAFVGASAAGPAAALEPDDIPEILGHVERRAADLGMTRLELEVPGPNEAAVRHLLARGFHIDPWLNIVMSNRPFGSFDRYIGFSPPIML